MARKPEIDINASQLAGLGNQDVKGREGRETVNPAELVAKAAVDWRNFLGSEIAVEEPTQKFLQYLERKRKEKASNMGILYWPGKDALFEKDSDYPGWLVRPNNWYWKKRSTAEIIRV